MFESKINRGRANGYAPLDGSGKVSLSYLPDVVGVAGTSGTSGANGSSGATGTNGTSGIDGTSGVNGTSGANGTSGVNGTSGINGTSGTSGLSIVASDFVRIVDVPTDNFGSASNEAGMLAFNADSIYFATQSYVQTTFYVNGYAEGTHVIVPNVPGLPNIQSNGWTITINGDEYDITGAYPPNGGDDYWYLEFDNLNTSITTSTQLMTLDNYGYEPNQIWGKIDFGFEIGKFVENALTSSIVKRVSILTSLTGSAGDKGGTIAFDSGAIYLANDSYYGTGPFTVSLYQNMESTPNFPITKGNFPKPKIGWTVSWANGALTATVTNVVEYTNYWLVYTNGGNSSISTPATITLTTNGLLDNVWLKNDFGFERGKFATTGSNQFNGNQTITGSLSVSGSNSTIILPNHASAPASPASGALYFNTIDFHFYGWNGGQWKQLDN